MIVGTAGHIDHGKTSLVHAITGLHTSRLAEEQRRGITIELGYASFVTEGGETISFVDVPGHEKFVRTMVAGASGIDFCLLLVAADDGVMPQTREHFSILRLLEVNRGALVLTKSDRVEAARIDVVKAEVSELVAGTAWQRAPIIATSAVSGLGIDALKSMLVVEAARARLHADSFVAFRVSLDRVFSLAGVGTVVAGSTRNGRVSVDDELCLAHQPARLLRVRSLGSHHAAKKAVSEGERAALGLHGLRIDEVSRGDVLCKPSIALSSSRLDVELHTVGNAIPSFRSGATVHVHCGTREVMGSVVLLGAPSSAPNTNCLAQLVLRSPISAWHGDRFVLRDASATTTVAGGRVLDPTPPTRYRQSAERLLQLRALALEDPRASLLQLVDYAPDGVDLARFRIARGWTHLPWTLSDENSIQVDTSMRWAISTSRIESLAEAAAASVTALHTSRPEEPGFDLSKLRRIVAPRLAQPLWSLIVSKLCESGSFVVTHGFVAAASHHAALDKRDRILVERATPKILAGAFEPPWVRTLANDLDVPEDQMRGALLRASKTGDLFQVVKDLYYHPQSMQKLALLVREHVDDRQQITAATFRDLTGLGRHRSIQILEFFDRVGLLRRRGNAHVLVTECSLFLTSKSSDTPQRVDYAS